ncbi:ImmA/IrrE family metallo-endopeptidase [Paenibacillus pasadenensis]|uniref:ImmA/IrrE family metallo-endopeptidase n=1 Tax=Paenibacillus pasadenensis TaxID=217090 RepID=UPI00048C5DE2|nr:ImmA/IrrE family metallo-endopeptidase [Paenibacillus pasadenensis]
MDKLVKKLVRRYKTNDPFLLAARMNIHVRFLEMDESMRGLYYRKLRRRFIVINAGLDPIWQRVVCAHEIAHDRLHPGISRFMLDEQSFVNVGKLERQANRFAVRLLTAGDELAADESLLDLLRRNDIPEQMSIFY